MRRVATECLKKAFFQSETEEQVQYLAKDTLIDKNAD
jgi:hypothetical protein